jgi:hypothetical protein
MMYTAGSNGTRRAQLTEEIMRTRIGWMLALGAIGFIATICAADVPCQAEKLRTPQPRSQGNFGRGIAISVDHVLAGEWPSRVHAFLRDGEAWVHMGHFTGQPLVGLSAFGRAVALSGQRAVIGAPHDFSAGINRGSAFAFEYDGKAWTQIAKLLPNGAVNNDRVGSAVAIDGDLIALGTQPNLQNPGKVFIYERKADQWVQTATLVATDYGGGNAFGRSVAVCNGRVFVAHRTAQHKSAGATGAVHVFERILGQWVEVQRIFADDAEAGTWFGDAVSCDADRLLIGARFAAAGDGTWPGAAYIFEHEPGGWMQKAKLLASENTLGAAFGSAVLLHEHRAVVGAQSDATHGEHSGAAFIFIRDGAAWKETAKITALDGRAGARFASDLAAYGPELIVASPWHGPAFQGAAYIFLADSGGDDLPDACVHPVICPAVDESCCLDRIAPGCCAGDCCGVVCEQRPSCCTVEWDDLCVTLASELCTDIGCSAGPAYCRGNCGGISPIGCWCDESCPEFGDCCPDWCDSCPAWSWCNNPSAPMSCAGRCGGSSGANCWCDEMCFVFGDCCGDVCTHCGSLRGCQGLDPHGCPDLVPGDLNGDGVVDVLDLLILLDTWGTCADPDDCPADLNRDGEVDVLDLLILLDNWG